MLFLGLTLLGVLACFGTVLLFGAPYLPTLPKQVQVAMDMVNLKPGQTLLELGCGDGKVLVAAAQRGWRVVGYELNPLLVVLCKLRTWRYHKLVSVRWGNFWTKHWPPADGIFIFALPRYMKRLDKKIIQSSRGPVKLVSFAFPIPNRTAVRIREGVHLYRYNGH
jgi:hypothetical protein